MRNSFVRLRWREFLVMETRGNDTLLMEVRAHSVDHGRWATEVDVDIATVQRCIRQMVGDVTFPRMRAVFGGDDGGEGEVWDLRSKGFQLVELDEIGIVGDAIDYVNRLVRAPTFQLLKHRQKRRQSGAAGKKQHRSRDITQIEASDWAGDGYHVSCLGPIGQIG